MRRLKHFALIVLVSISPLEWYISYSLMVPSSSSPAHTRMNKMGVIERKHHHILETARALLISSFVPHSFWTEVVITSINLINIIMSSVLAGKSRHEHLCSYPPDCSMLCAFGCTCYVFHLIEHTKLSERSAKCVLLGISSEQKVITTMILWQVIFLYHVISFLLRTLLIFLLHLRMFTLYRHLIYHLLSLLEFLLIWSL